MTKNLYIATFEDSNQETGVVWFVAEVDKRDEVAMETIRDWECLDDEDEVTLGQVYEVDRALINEVGGNV